MAVKIDGNECISCGMCVDACPQEALTLDGACVVDEDSCIECGICINICPARAISE